MINRLMTAIGLKYLSKKLDGHKTKIASFIPIIYGLLGAIGSMYPELQQAYNLPNMNANEIIFALGGGGVAYGAADKAKKIEKAVSNKTVEHTDEDITMGN